MHGTACCAALMHTDYNQNRACKASKPCLLSPAGRCLKAHPKMTHTICCQPGLASLCNKVIILCP